MKKYISGLVSVIIPTYKRSEMLLRAINSVLNQTYDKIELIVVNDNIPNDEYSKELYEKISSIKDKRLLFVEQEKHINGAAARNFGIKKAKGEFISFLDDDDYWVKEKIEHQLKLLQSLDDSYGGVSCLLTQIKNDKLIGAKVPYNTKNLMERVLSRRVRIGTGSVLLRREALDQCGYFDESLNRHQEIQLFGYFASKYKIKLLKEYLYVVDISDNQNRPNIEKLEKIKKDFYKSVSPLMKKLSHKQQQKIYLMHEAEIVVAYIKNKNYSKVINCMFKMLRYPSTIFYTIKLAIDRLINRKFKYYLINKFKY